MAKIYHYDFDPDLILHKLKSPSSLVTNKSQPDKVLSTKRLPRSLRRVNSLNSYISSPDHVWVPLCIVFSSPITSYDGRWVYIENDTDQ